MDKDVGRLKGRSVTPPTRPSVTLPKIQRIWGRAAAGAGCDRRSTFWLVSAALDLAWAVLFDFPILLMAALVFAPIHTGLCFEKWNLGLE